MSSKLNNKTELIIGLELDDLLEDYRKVVTAVNGYWSLAKAWKAFAHAGTDKNFRGFLEAYNEFSTICPTAHPELRGGCVSDIIKARVTTLVAKGDYEKASSACALQAVRDHYGLPMVEASKVQSSQIQAVLKQVARKLCNIPDELATTWFNCLEAAGQHC